jgi:GDP-mannose transporter
VLAYTWNDEHFTLAGYTWLGIWFVISVAEIVWIKKVIQSVDMTNWERSFYQNAMAVPLMIALALFSGETGVAATSILDHRAWPSIAASCLAGVGLSYFSFALCEAVSATTFTVIGNVCKVLSILVNVLMANQHSSESPIFLLSSYFPFQFVWRVKRTSPKNARILDKRTLISHYPSFFLFCYFVGAPGATRFSSLASYSALFFKSIL